MSIYKEGIKVKPGVYMGPTGQLFQLMDKGSYNKSHVILNVIEVTDEYVLITADEVLFNESARVYRNSHFILPGYGFEMKRLLEGFEYLGEL